MAETGWTREQVIANVPGISEGISRIDAEYDKLLDDQHTLEEEIQYRKDESKEKQDYAFTQLAACTRARATLNTGFFWERTAIPLWRFGKQMKHRSYSKRAPTTPIITGR